jgi:O-acetyl-ADP-ribose deacetylase (regulator of RNase III)
MLGDDIRLSNQWGGMEAGPGMLYPSQTVDGSVHVAGGKELFRSLQDQFNELRTTKQVDKLPPGHVVLTQPSGRLRSACGYDLIAHVVSPLRNEHNNDSIGVLNGESRNGGGGGGYDEDDDDDDDNNRGIEALYVLQCSYRNVFSLVRETNSVADGSDGAQRMRVITTPLIGAGCGGYSTEESVQAMLKAVSENWHFDVRDSDNCRYHPDYDDADTSTNETDYLSAYLPAKLDKDSSLLRIVVRSRHDADVLMTQFLRMKAMNKYLDEA